MQKVEHATLCRLASLHSLLVLHTGPLTHEDGKRKVKKGLPPSKKKKNTNFAQPRISKLKNNDQQI